MICKTSLSSLSKDILFKVRAIVQTCEERPSMALYGSTLKTDELEWAIQIISDTHSRVGGGFNKVSY